jgi:hypothetical protein
MVATVLEIEGARARRRKQCVPRKVKACSQPAKENRAQSFQRRLYRQRRTQTPGATFHAPARRVRSKSANLGSSSRVLQVTKLMTVFDTYDSEPPPSLTSSSPHHSRRGRPIFPQAPDRAHLNSPNPWPPQQKLVCLRFCGTSASSGDVRPFRRIAAAFSGPVAHSDR